MLELYHQGSSVSAAKVRFLLAEKGLEWTGRYVDILKGEQFGREYLKLNPKAVVPTLVHDGRVIVESTIICEYLDEVFPEPPLKPADAFDRAKMRVWTKALDEDVHPACADLTYVACHRHIIRRANPQGVPNVLDATPNPVATERIRRKRELVELGFEAPRVADNVKLYDSYLQKMEDALKEQPWLAGATFSLADVGFTPYVNRLDMLGMAGLWEDRRPHVTDWFQRIKERPTFDPALLEWCPADLTGNLLTYGTQSLPELQEILGIG